MTKLITIEVTFAVTERETKFGSAGWLKRALCDYLTNAESPLMDDYSENAWGGYEGAYITDATINRASVTDAP